MAERLVRPPPKVRQRLLRRFDEMVVEFEQRRFGREMRLRTLLVEQRVDLLRWEQETGREAIDIHADFDWKPSCHHRRRAAKGAEVGRCPWPIVMGGGSCARSGLAPDR